MSKPTIYINGRFLTRAVTGVERTAYELVTALDELVDGSYNYVLIYSGELVTPITLKHIRLLKKGILKGNLWEQFELPVYTHGSLLVSLCTITSLFKSKQLLMVHDACFVAHPEFFHFGIRNWYRFAIPFLGKKLGRLLTVSAFSKAELVRYFKLEPESITVIPNAADHLLKYSEPGEEFKEKIAELKPYVLAVSSRSSNKNFRSISHAIRNIDFTGYRMLIAGGIIATLQQSEEDMDINYLGYVSDAELKYLYQHASLFIFPSFYEGFGIPPLEAMISGCPVLSSNTSAMPEVLAEGCAYFDPYEESGLTVSLQELLRNQEKLNGLRIKGKDRAARYQWKHSAKKLQLLMENYGS